MTTAKKPFIELPLKIVYEEPNPKKDVGIEYQINNLKKENEDTIQC